MPVDEIPVDDTELDKPGIERNTVTQEITCRANFISNISAQCRRGIHSSSCSND